MIYNMSVIFSFLFFCNNYLFDISFLSSSLLGKTVSYFAAKI